MSNCEFIIYTNALMKLKYKTSGLVSDRDQISDNLSKENMTDDGIQAVFIKFTHLMAHYNAKI